MKLTTLVAIISLISLGGVTASSKTGKPSTEAAVKAYLSPDFLKVLLDRIKENRRTADQDTLDLTTVVVGMEKLKYTPEQLGTTQTEIDAIARRVVLKSIRTSIASLEKTTLTKVDKDIEITTIRAMMDLHEIQPQEVGVSPERLEKLLGR